VGLLIKPYARCRSWRLVNRRHFYSLHGTALYPRRLWQQREYRVGKVINRPNVVGDPFAGTRTLTADFNTAAFAPNGQYQYGSVGRNTMSARSQKNLDFIATKSFHLTERFKLDFRFEAFNASNTPPFGAPNAVLGTNGFGSITGAGTPRNLQFGLKLLF